MRKVANLVRNLPPEAALRRALDPDGSAWSTSDHLLASILEVVDSHRVNYVAAHSKTGAKVPKPIRVPRPGEKKPKRRGTTLGELKTMVKGSPDA